MSDSRGQWLTVSEAAAMSNLSSRTIRRRCADGDLVARFESGVWKIDGQGIGQSDTPSANRTRPIGQSAKPSDSDLSAPSANRTDGHGQSAKDARPIGHDIGQTATTGDRREIEVELRAQLVREREFSAVLKSQLEAVTQSEAQTKAALREALRAMPKQLTAGTSSATGDDAARDGPGRAQSAEMGDHSPKPSKGSPGRAGASESAVFDYNAIADKIERRLNQ